MEETFLIFVNTVPADGIAPLGARPSAVKGMTNFVSSIISTNYNRRV